MKRRDVLGLLGLAPWLARAQPARKTVVALFAGEEEDPFVDEPFDDEPMPPRAPWWRWVAIVVAVALVVATPFAYALSRLLD